MAKLTPIGEGFTQAEVDVKKAADHVYDCLVTAGIKCSPDNAVGMVALAISSMLWAGVTRRQILKMCTDIMGDLPGGMEH